MGRRHRRPSGPIGGWRERGTRRVAVIAVVVAVLAGLFGAAALASPTARAQLGIGPPAASAYPPVPIPELSPLAPTAPVPTQAGLSKALSGPASAPELGNLSGVVLDSTAARGSAPLWQRGPDEAMVPGSVTKLLTAAAALLSLNPTDRLATKVVPGPTPDSVVLVGGGDPSLTALPVGKNSVYPEPARIDELAEQVKKAVGRPISTVYTDASLWTGPELARSWDPADVGTGDVAPMSALMLDGGRTDPTIQDGPRSDDPAAAAGQALADALGAEEVEPGRAVPNSPTLGSVASPPIASLIEYMLTASDNVTAEAMARQVAISRQGDPSFDGAAKETSAALSQAGYATSGLVLNDGSGLSPDNRISTSLLGSVLASASAVSQNPNDVQYLRPILTGLPVAGGGGTLADRFTDGRAIAGRGVVRAKTGTLSGASSLAGVVSDVDGRLLVFAFISNGTSPADARPKLDVIAAALSRCGCRG
ncbi:D-alanyl-D-alanine carboxypeptidase/D-alanyl-D-alanine-endopeptidase [Pseudonocardia sp. KRD291]|uniref:D-alanyl-D-alanine carboxypeptidase/D-alanyl-D-alanine endopeptidase n=1 Tax=Pseudonocardia sp. KRD291 TaxID=2792007 RepID=UPI001C4A6ACF|nr:D-alanyl-D-alanine carboxypeptidase/D-alanyl-D-alanine-endopeptidase [Pseudonocardia sp. KRD291]MBW0102834.1 D-alanyl-D-alanine carboxypeptidase/D-alanyl-D-alanine-endopeptidase [Pseudonocardia sp. KRD291]